MNWKRAVLISIPFFTLTLFWQAYDYIVPLMLSRHYRLGTTVYSMLMSVDNIIALIFLPLFGILSDRISSRLGRRSPLILIGTVGGVAGLVFMNLADTHALSGENTFALFLKQVFSIMFSIIKPGGSFYVFHADSEGENFRKSLRSSGFKIAQCCIWVKDSLVMGRQDYQWQHEPCLYGWKPGAAHFWNSDRKQTTVWNFDKPRANRIHPTMKPVALMAYPVCNSTKTGEVVADFFSGSGSTIMACQQVDRLCYAMEIDPKYVSASVLRFRTMFPEQPVRLIRDGVLMSADETTKLCSL